MFGLSDLAITQIATLITIFGGFLYQGWTTSRARKWDLEDRAVIKAKQVDISQKLVDLGKRYDAVNMEAVTEKLDEIHELTNSNSTEQMKRIGELEDVIVKILEKTIDELAKSKPAQVQ